jgi:uncharacterized protein (TIGR02611 family)
MRKLKAIFDRPHDEVMKDLHERRERQRERNPVARVLVVLAGFVLALAGLVMTVLPGPKLAAAVGGSYLLAFEFDWAERLVAWSLRKTEAAKRKYERAGPLRKYGMVALAIVLVVAFVAGFRILAGAVL